jgi:hypothetical protein
LGRDCNCREYGGCSGDIFFIVIRQKFHSESPPRISEMTDGGHHRDVNRCRTCITHQAAIRQ